MKPFGTLFLLASLLCSLLFPASLEGQDSMNISLLYHWEDTTMPSSDAFGNSYNEIWGFVEDGREYAVIGSTRGTHIFDVSDPANAHQVEMIPGAHQGSDIIHRDYHDHQGYLYMVSDEGNSTLQVVDLSPLPDSVELVYDSDQHFITAHNIFIDSSSSRLYACGATTSSHTDVDLMILSLSNPEDPSHLRDYNSTHYFHDIFVRNDTAYGHHGDDAGLIVYEMSDPTDVDVLGSLPYYSDKGYNHSGWLSSSGDHYVMADETNGARLKLLDVTELWNIREESLFLSGVDENSMAHNPIIHGDHVFVSHYHDGVYIWDISDPQHPYISGYYDTYPPSDHDSYRGAWGVYPFLPSGILLASDMQSGLFVFSVDSALNSLPSEELERRADLKVNPTLAKEEVFISGQEALKGPIRVTVLDLKGRTLLQREFEEDRKEMRIGLSELNTSGMHLLRVESAGQSVAKKFVIRR